MSTVLHPVRAGRPGPHPVPRLPSMPARPHHLDETSTAAAHV